MTINIDVDKIKGVFSEKDVEKMKEFREKQKDVLKKLRDTERQGLTEKQKDFLKKQAEKLKEKLDDLKEKKDPETGPTFPRREIIPFRKFKEGERFPGMEPFYRFPKNFDKMTPEQRRKEYERYLMLLEAKKNAKGGEIKKFKRGGLAEATARLKAQELSAGGTVIKTKTVAMDKSPNSALITQRGFGASRRT